MKPYMQQVEIDVLKMIFEAQQPRNVLEWGVGGSTRYFTERFDCIDCWDGIEHNREWCERVRTACKDDPRVTIHFRRLGPEYWRTAAEQAREYDLILVDGRERVRCMDVAQNHLSPLGVVILHDAWRPRYQSGVRRFQHVLEFCQPPPGSVDGRGLKVMWNSRKWLADIHSRLA